MKSIEFTQQLSNYILQINPEENGHLQQLREKTDALKYGRLRSPTEQIHFFTFLLQFLQPQAILEIGTFTGYTTLAMALATNENTQIITCDINNVFPQIGLDIWEEAGVNKRIKLILGKAIDTLNQLQEEKQQFDFIYIDADKENSIAYFKMALTLLTNHGLILIDNVLWRGHVCDEAIQDQRTRAMREFNHWLTEQRDIRFCVLPICDGLTLVSKAL